MTYSHLTPAPCQWFGRLASPLDRRSAPRLALLSLGAILARGRRSVAAPGSGNAGAAFPRQHRGRCGYERRKFCLAIIQ